MSSKCLELECQYNKPINKLRSQRQNTTNRHSSGHSKNFKKRSVQVSGRCLLEAFKRRTVCPKDPDEYYPTPNDYNPEELDKAN